MKYISSLILICLHGLPASAPTQTNYKALIIGRWQSEIDHKYEVVFAKNYRIDYYDKKTGDTFFYKIKGDSLIAISKSDSSIYYYTIEGISKKYLSLMYLARGNSLVFRRELVNLVSTTKK
jgi:hypothetical protein